MPRGDSRKFSTRWPRGLLMEVDRFRELFGLQFGVTLTLSRAIILLVKEGLKRQSIIDGYGYDPSQWVHLPGRDADTGACGLEMSRRKASCAADGSDLTCPACIRMNRMRRNDSLVSGS